MKKIIHNIVTLLIGIVGLFGGLIWGYYSKWEFEPIILSAISFLEIIAYFTLPKEKKKEKEISNKSKNTNKQKVEVTVNNFTSNNNDVPSIEKKNRNALIDSKKTKIGILFIDDDKKFNIVKILKDSNWKNTKTVTDIKSLDVSYVQNSEIIFVDINGVGKILNLEYEGLDLALMLKQKYPEKKIIIYSANKNSNSFHKAWDIIDGRLEKSALPYQFQNLVENYSLEYYK
ncbi:response regulator [uncultured Polaribacter sp.]|uniref:response regulator n=1 Tax=uncultured Polaribacter sp. TaxID=174711 RepID=UPI0026361627|nr:response regulator [uncultured Polaribacter sp.]